MSDDLDDVNRALNRRDVLKIGAGALASAAGCTSSGEEEDTTQPPIPTTTETTETDTTTKQTTKQSEPERDFKEIYADTIDDLKNTRFYYNSRVLPRDRADNISINQKDLSETFLEANKSLAAMWDFATAKPHWKRSVRMMRALFTNQLDIGPDEARSGLMRTGGNFTFMNHKYKDTVDGQEIVRKLTGLVPTHPEQQEIDPLYIPWKEDGSSVDGSETYLQNVWDNGDLTSGSAMAIENYRTGVFRSKTFEEYVLENNNPGTWLSGSRALDGQNDFVVYDPEWKERAEWGEIGYSREAATVIHDFMHLHENQDFTEEWEMEEELTEMYHNEEVVGDYDTFIHVDVTEDGLEEDQRKLTEVDGQIVYAELCGFEQHKKDAYEIAIPDQFWPEHRYPGDVELPDEYEDDNRPEMVDPEVSPL